ncbi:hypothetical protein D3C80_1558630 [compost metagenome]
MVHVRYHHLELVVRFHAGHQVAFEHLGQAADFRLEVFEALRGVSVHADHHVGGQAQAEHLAIEQGHLASDVAIIFQLLDPARAG